MSSANQARARAFFERLAGEEPATELVSALIQLLDDAEARGPRLKLSGDSIALELIKGTVREKLKAVVGKGGVMAFPAVALNDTAANIATAVATALDNYEAPEDETAPPEGGR